jgi:hypothetical protein
MYYVSCIIVSCNLRQNTNDNVTITTQTTRQTNDKTYLYNINNKTNKRQDLPLQQTQQDWPLQHKQQDKLTTRLTFRTQTKKITLTTQTRRLTLTTQTTRLTYTTQTTRLTFTTQSTRHMNIKIKRTIPRQAHTKQKWQTTTRHMNIKIKSTIPRQTHTKQKNAHLVSQDFTHRMITKSQQKVWLTSNLNSNTFIQKLLATTHLS